jgi:hypothetical protein
MTEPDPTPHHIYLISRVSQIAHNREHDNRDSFILCRGLCHDFITFWRLENLYVMVPTKHNHIYIGVRLGDHYMSLQMFLSGPLLHQADPRYSNTLPGFSRARYIPKVSSLVSKLFHTGHVSYPIFMPKTCTHGMHDPGSNVPHIRPKVLTDNQMS